MANEYSISLGPDGAGWTVRIVTFAPGWAGDFQTIDPSGQVWNGTAFVADSFANRTLGGLLLTESLIVAGTFEGDLQDEIIVPAIYPVIAYHQLGGSFNSQTDKKITSSDSTIEVSLAESDIDYAHKFPYTQNIPVEGETEFQDNTVVIGEGRNCVFFPVKSGTTGPEIATPLSSVSDWKIKVRGFGILASLEYTDALGNLGVDLITGRIVANVTASQTSAFKPGRNGYYELWRIGPGDDQVVCIQRAKLRTND